MLTKSEVSELLGRSLSSNEDANFDLYMEIAEDRLESLLCMDLSTETTTRYYQTREGYRTLFTDPFISVTSVTIDETNETDYEEKLNDKYSSSWFNSIEFDDRMTGKKVAITAAWGFGTMPADLKMLLARLFAQGTTEQKSDNQVKSKKIEDFTVTFKDGSTFSEFVLSNQSVIDKYSLCHVGRIKHGSVRAIRHHRLHLLEA